MSEEYLRYRIFENQVKEHSPDFIRWLNKVHHTSIEEMIKFFEEGYWDVRFGRDRDLRIEIIDELIKNVKPYWKTAGF